MEALHEDIVSEVLSHIPDAYLQDCKLVCKRWRDHLRNKKLGFLFTVASRNDEIIQLYHADYNVIKSAGGHEGYCYETSTTKISLPLVIRKTDEFNVVVGSCNGLVCFVVPHLGLEDPIYICNPVTREYMSLPMINTKIAKTGQTSLVVSGFGYLPSRNEYKVVRILYPHRLPYPDATTVGWVQVCTIGKGSSNGWRNVGVITDSLYLHGTHVTGVLYWKDKKNHKIVAFDLEDEVFRIVPPPPCIRPEEQGIEMLYWLLNFGGDLSFVDHVWGDHVDVWTFKKNTLEGTNDNFNMNKHDFYHSWSWIKEVNIEWEGDTHDCNFYDPFALTKSNEVLLWYNETILRCYDPKTRSFTELIVGGALEFQAVFGAIPHINNKVSLKEFGFISN
ncbi:F-box protein At3g07870-like [Papaver somniferum]|uniref:F-box protein At3g07870-like n=1 Tax=Papaver somniferum TaxID=3469 RepID=UPI000E6FC6E1|nr:F-box protein At3g07870-like [Papaver somniferum]